jgi:hypothetical protein
MLVESKDDQWTSLGHDVFGHRNAVPSSYRLQPYFLLINKQLRE